MSRSRGVLLPVSADPFPALLSLWFYKNRWQLEVDDLYICYNNTMPINPSVVNEFLSQIIDPRIHFIFHPHTLSHGSAIKELLSICHNEYIMLLEEDAYIFEPGIVNECFEKIESGEFDAVGSLRGSCTPQVLRAAKETFNLNYEGYGDQGPAFWPNFFFIKKEILGRTRRDFDSHQWHIGDYEHILDWHFTEESAGDTFVRTSLELRAMGLSFLTLPQHKASPNEWEEKLQHQQNWHETQLPFKWIHAGSLSSGMTGGSGFLMGHKLDIGSDGARLDLETRVAFWTIAKDTVRGFSEYKRQYEHGIESLTIRGGLNREHIKQKIALYKELMKL